MYVEFDGVGMRHVRTAACKQRRVAALGMVREKKLQPIWAIQDRANQVPYHGPYQEPIK